MKLVMGERVRRWVGYVWLCLLAGALLVSGLSTDRRARQVEEYACFCDPYGYLQSAREVRQAEANRRWPDFTITSSQSRLLIDMFRVRQVPYQEWQELVAPLCHHYFPRTDRIGVQYPPGTGIMLAFFPEGKALHRLDRLAVLALVGTGLAMLAVAAIKKAWLSAGFMIFTLTVGLEVLAGIDNASFSINAMFVPIMLSSLLLVGAFALRNKRAASLYWTCFFAFLAGWEFGFAILVRLQIVFLLPGIIALLWPSSLRRRYQSALPSFSLGLIIGGLLPLAIYQSRLAGAWYLPTYAGGNANRPTLKSLVPNLRFYFQPGKPSQFNWTLPVMIVACLGLFVWSRLRVNRNLPSDFLHPLSWRRVSIACVLTWAIPTLYFLTHEVTTHYYPIPTIFVTLLLLALCALRLEQSKRAAGFAQRAVQVAAFTLALVPGSIAIGRAWSNYSPPTIERKPHHFELPAELADEHAWVWAAELSGTVGYYADKAAHKIDFASPETRLMAYEFVRRRGEPQYLIVDDPDMQLVQDEITQFGAVLEQRGEVEGYFYYLIHWPGDSFQTQAQNPRPR